MHRDVSPQNLLVTFDGSLKVVDFGIAKIADHATASGKLKGKLAYMAPEQARTQPVDARTDVFSLGVVLFELLARSRLFPRADELEILNRMIGSEVFPKLRERRPEASPELEAIVAKAMAARPEERFQSAQDFQAALEDWLVTYGYRATGADVSAYLKDLFAERIVARRAAIDAAKRGDLPSTAATARALVPMSSDSGSGWSSVGGQPTARGPAPAPEVSITLDPTAAPRTAPRSPPRRAGAAVAAALAVAAVAAGAWLATRPVAQVDSGAAAAVDAGPPARPASATLTVEVTPAAAQVLVDGAPRKPGALDLPPGPHALAVSAEGYVTDARTVTLAAGERVSLIISLEHTPDAQPLLDPEKVATRRPDKPPRAAAKGTLKLDTTPWTSVFLGGRKLGDTPILNAKLPAGRHVLRLVNAEAGVDQSIEVEIAANAETVKRLRVK